MCSKNVLDVSKSSMETAFKKDVDLITNRYVWHLFPHEANLAQEKASGDCDCRTILYNYAYETRLVSNLCPKPCVEPPNFCLGPINVIAPCTG